MDWFCFVRIIQACRHPKPWLQSNKSSADVHLFGWVTNHFTLPQRWTPFVLASKEGREWREKHCSMLFLLVFSCNSLNLMPFVSWPASFGPIKCPSLAIQPQSQELHRCIWQCNWKRWKLWSFCCNTRCCGPVGWTSRRQRVTVKPSSPQRCVFLQFPQMDG